MAFPQDRLLIPGTRIPSSPVSRDAPRGALPSAADAVVVGAGVIGLSLAWRLAQEGLRTVVVERSEPGSGASLAATGMLAAAAELEAGGEDLLPFALASRDMWLDFRRRLEAASGVDLDYDSRGTLVVALTRDETERLRARHDLHRRSGLSTEFLSGVEARRREPSLRASTTAALACPDDHQVDPRRLIPALDIAFRRAGGLIACPVEVTGLDMEGGRCSGVVTTSGDCRARIVVVASGAWAGSCGFLPGDFPLPLRPLKGQSLALTTSRSSPAPRHVIWTEQVHIAPKADGRMIVGATVEEAGFDTNITAGGVFALLDGARRALPGVENMPVDAIWCGFRPTSDDDAPILGPGPVAGLLYALGHHRNGVLLAPATAEALWRVATGREPMREAGPLHLERFRRTG